MSEKMTENAVKILTRKEKQELQFLIEEFLEKKEKQLEKGLRDHPEKAGDYLERLHKLLFRNTFWMDEVDASDMEPSEWIERILQWHHILKPCRHRFRKEIFDIQCRVEPTTQTPNISSGESESDDSPYNDLIAFGVYNPEDTDKSYNFEPIQIELKFTVSFENNRITVHKRNMGIVYNFFDTLNNIPVDLFARCKFCKKCIVLSRLGKEYCPGCGAKAKQQERWKEDPEGARERERKRYKEKRR